MEKIDVTRKLLYDGSEKEMPSKFELVINSKVLTFTRSKVYHKSFHELKNIISHENFNTISSGLTLEKFGDISLYLINGSDAYYTIIDNYILLFSFTESQPDRYKVFFESAWLFN